jgi:uncharacterized membrane protein
MARSTGLRSREVAVRVESLAVRASVAVPAESGRQLPFDWLRGLVMVLMTIDHASGEFNAGRLFTDATFMYRPGTPLPLDQFLTRWITPSALRRSSSSPATSCC